MAGPRDAAVIGGAAAAAVGGTAVAAQGTVLGMLGFTAVGPAAGSWAAAWMSSITLANGVGVTAPSMYAAAQSAAMGGTAILGAPFVVTCVAVGATVGAVGWWSLNRGNGDGAPGGGAPATDPDEEAKGGGDGAPGGGAPATDLAEEAKGEESSEDNRTEGDESSEENGTEGDESSEENGTEGAESWEENGTE